MLHTITVKNELLELLIALMQAPEYTNFNLVGGTALSLQLGHRSSIDIDLFGKGKINENSFLTTLKALGETTVLKKSENILITTVNGIKVDIVNYTYPLIRPIILEDNIRLISKEDIAAMKLNAIAGRGSKKDFIDLYFLLSYFSLQEMIHFYKQKYRDGSEFMVIKSLTYFEDAESEQEPMMFMPFDWEKCKEVLKQKTNKLMR